MDKTEIQKITSSRRWVTAANMDPDPANWVFIKDERRESTSLLHRTSKVYCSVTDSVIGPDCNLGQVAKIKYSTIGPKLVIVDSAAVGFGIAQNNVEITASNILQGGHIFISNIDNVYINTCSFNGKINLKGSIDLKHLECSGSLCAENFRSKELVRLKGDYRFFTSIIANKIDESKEGGQNTRLTMTGGGEFNNSYIYSNLTGPLRRITLSGWEIHIYEDIVCVCYSARVYAIRDKTGKEVRLEATNQLYCNIIYNDLAPKLPPKVRDTVYGILYNRGFTDYE